MVTTASPRLTPFTAAHEGFVTKTYKDPGGVLTIGHGFTMLSATFAAYWRTKYGRALRLGDTITKEESLKVLGILIEREYAPSVAKAMPATIRQNEFDASTDMVYNCGAGTLKDQWAQALKKGDVNTAADKLKTTRTTAKGRVLQGLIKRRADEARMLRFGDYGEVIGGPPAEPAISTTLAAIIEYQNQLITLGYFDGKPGDPSGRGSETDLAVRRFQEDEGLTVDGRVGPATRASLARAIGLRAATPAVVAGGLATGGGTVMAQAPEATSGTVAWQGLAAFAIGIVIVAAVVLVWRNRGNILKRRTPA